MYSRSVLDPTLPWMKSNPAFFLIVTAEVHENTVSGSRNPGRDSEDGDREIKEEEEHSDEDGGSGRETREKDLSEDHIIHSEARSVGGNTHPVDGEENGFKTPVPADHREMDSVTECPPAPKKPKPVAQRKRKEMPGYGGDGNADAVGLVIHLSDEEVVAMFPEILPARKKIKKARRDESDDSHDDRLASIKA